MSFDREWQDNSIQKILKNFLAMLQVSLVSPKIVCSPRKLQLSKTSKWLYFQDLLENYIKEKNIKPTIASSSMLYSHLLKIIDFFQDDDLQSLDYFEKGRLGVLEPLDESLVDAFQLLQIVTDKRLKKSAISELNNEKKIHELYQENEKIKSHIKAVQIALKRKSLCSKWKLAAEEIFIQNYEKDLAYCKYENNLRIKQEIILSSSSIRQIHATSVAKQRALKGELTRITEIYENMLSKNLSHEKSARNERNKLLLQLDFIVKKFDQTIGDQTKECMDLQEEYEKRKELLSSFLTAYKQQEIEYDRIVCAKNEEEKHHHEQKILLFMMNRSARVIQKRWRRFRRAQKKASKRSKGRAKAKKK